MRRRFRTSVAAERAMARWARPRSGGSACPAELATRDQGHVAVEDTVEKLTLYSPLHLYFIAPRH
eukprot:2554423-Prymnesium_polylepis.1